MPRRRHAANPRKLRIDSRRLEALAPGAAAAPTGWAGRGALRRRLTPLLGGLLTVALLAVSFAPLDFWPAAYVALVPWTLALLCGPSRRWALLCAWLSGLVAWALAVYWLAWITLVGYAALVVYASAYWLAAGAVLRAALRRGWPAWACLPVVWVALEFARAYVISGFPWFNLAQTQYRVAPLIQIADVTGQYGLSFLVAMVNGAIADRLARWMPNGAGKQAAAGKRFRFLGPLRAGEAMTVLTGVAVLLYGAWRLSERTQSEGPVIGIVQGAYPIALGMGSPPEEEVLQFHIDQTRGFLPARQEPNAPRPDLVVWPETMLPTGMNRQVLDANISAMGPREQRRLLACFLGPRVWGEVLPDGTVQPYADGVIREALKLFLHGGTGADGTAVAGRREMAAGVRALAGELGCPILAGGTTFHPNAAPLDAHEGWRMRNSALWIDPNGAQGPMYSKVHLVPFSESVPFRQSWPGLHRLLRWFVPGVMPQLQSGADRTVFELRRPGGLWRLVTPICYEGTFARVCRRMVWQSGRKAADLMVNISNDGWFVWSHNRRLRCPKCGWRGQDMAAERCPRCGGGHLRAEADQMSSSENAQHLAHYCFRAVEQRVPVVRAVNTGISASIDSNGRIVAEVAHPARPALRTMVSGTLLLDGRRKNDVEFLRGHGPKVLVDSRTSWYSRHGDLFAAAVCLAAALATAGLMRKRRAVVKEGDGL